MLALKAAVVGPWTTHSASQNCPDPPAGASLRSRRSVARDDGGVSRVQDRWILVEGWASA